MFGYRAEEIVGQNLTVLMPESLAREHKTGLRRYLESGESNVVGRTTEVGLDLASRSWWAEGSEALVRLVRD